MRGQITTAKGNVAKWSKIKDCYLQDLKQSQADGADKVLNKAFELLAQVRKRFEDLRLPEHNAPDTNTAVCSENGCKSKATMTYKGFEVCMAHYQSLESEFGSY